MNGYKFIINTAVYMHDKFSHNCERIEIVHARSEKEARTKLVLKKGYDIPDIEMQVTDEMIYTVYNLGRVRKVWHYEYGG